MAAYTAYIPLIYHEHLFRIKHHGQPVPWCSFNLEPDNNKPGFVVIHRQPGLDNSGHDIIYTQIEVFYNGQPYWHSVDVWFPGMVKTYG